MASQESVAKARKAADDYKKANKGKTNSSLESDLAAQMADARADHNRRGQNPPRWATNR